MRYVKGIHTIRVWDAQREKNRKMEAGEVDSPHLIGALRMVSRLRVGRISLRTGKNTGN